MIPAIDRPRMFNKNTSPANNTVGFGRLCYRYRVVTSNTTLDRLIGVLDCQSRSIGGGGVVFRVIPHLGARLIGGLENQAVVDGGTIDPCLDPDIGRPSWMERT